MTGWLGPKALSIHPLIGMGSLCSLNGWRCAYIHDTYVCALLQFTTSEIQVMLEANPNISPLLDRRCVRAFATPL